MSFATYAGVMLKFAYHEVGGDEGGGAHVKDETKGSDAETNPSGLSAMIRMKQGSSGRGLSGPGLIHTVYLPDLSSFLLELPMKFTVEETIYAILEVSRSVMFSLTLSSN